MFATQTPKGPATFLVRVPVIVSLFYYKYLTLHIQLDRNRSWFFIPHLLFPLRGKDNEYHNETLMDGELVMDIDENKVRQTHGYACSDHLNSGALTHIVFRTKRYDS
jgi:hypothetical protein